jgi:Lar family restriction alleviation protein
MTKPDLKPCPFCGGGKHTICRTDYDYDNKDAYAVSCRYHNCHGSIFSLGYGYFATKDEAIAAWNTRAIDPAAIREAALREAATQERHDLKVDALEAKLAKAVLALRLFKFFDDMPLSAKRPDVFERKVRPPILATLAEIEEETK